MGGISTRKNFMRTLVAIAAMAAIFTPAGRASAAPVDFKVQLFLQGGKKDIQRPVDLAWVRGTDKLFFSEEDDGRIWMIDDGRLVKRPCVNLDVATEHDKGLTGLAAHPEFVTNKYLYAYYTNAEPLENRLVRFTVTRGLCTNPTIILGGLDTGLFHQGGQMVFDAQNRLYVTTGDNGDSDLAQSLNSLMGKVLRLNDDGTVPADNPFPADHAQPRSPIWSFGHRNGFGLAYRAAFDQIFETENGPWCDDELNLIVRGANYGWGPGYGCFGEGYSAIGPSPREPLFRWNPGIAPTDAWWYDGSAVGIESLPDALYLGDYLKSQLHSFRYPIVAPLDDVVYNFNNPEHRIISVSEGPGGWLYLVARSNIYRLVPGDSEEVAVKDDPYSFDPTVSAVGVGGFVRWQRENPTSTVPHDIVQTQGIFRMPVTEDPIDYTRTFSAGRFPYVCTLHAQQDMRGVVKVAPQISEGPDGPPFMVWWASKTSNTGDLFDVDYKVGDGPWRAWQRDTLALRATFGREDDPVTLQTDIEYSFRARSRKGTAQSRWSPVTTKTLVTDPS
ncbi:MAG: PQQ-dependent sugar dehydrogenase [Actinomycetota bacterium]|nr:PQQ-dependent sugar dehydrogenase [Actinomycetota bacterium]